MVAALKEMNEAGKESSMNQYKKIPPHTLNSVQRILPEQSQETGQAQTDSTPEATENLFAAEIGMD